MTVTWDTAVYLTGKLILLPYSGKLSRGKTFANFAVLWLYAKFSPRNLGRDVLWRCKSEQSAQVFSAKIVFPPIRKSFLPRKFPAIRYMAVTFYCKIHHWEIDQGKPALWARGWQCYLLRESCLTLEIKEFRCYEVKIQKSEARSVLGSTHVDCQLFHFCLTANRHLNSFIVWQQQDHCMGLL